MLLAGTTDARYTHCEANFAILAVSVGVLVVLLTARSQAASLLVVPLAILTPVAVVRRTGPPRHLVAAVGLLTDRRDLTGEPLPEAGGHERRRDAQ